MSAGNSQPDILHGTFSSDGPLLHWCGAAPAQAWAHLAILPGYGDHAMRFAHVLTALATAGVAAYALDFRGHGVSLGRRGFVGQWDEYHADVAAFLRLPAIAAAGPPLFVLGHSHGGLVAAAAGIRGLLSDTAGCVLSAPFFYAALPVPIWKKALAHTLSPLLPALRIRSGLRDEMMSNDPAMVADSRADPLLLHSATPRWYVTMRRTQRQVQNNAEKFDRPLLTLIAGADAVADNRATEDFHRRAGAGDKSIKTYAGQRHELLRDVARDQVLGDILQWMRSKVGKTIELRSALATS